MGGGWLKKTYGERQVTQENRKRYYGRPGQVKSNRDHGYLQQTLIGRGSRAVRERHNTDHGRPDQHSNPHDHIIEWDGKGNPQPSTPVNYRGGKKPPPLKRNKP